MSCIREIIESENIESAIRMVQTLEGIKNAGCNAFVVYLENFAMLQTP